MIKCTSDNLASLLSSCADGMTKLAAIAIKNEKIMEEFRDTILNYFMGKGIKGVESVKQCLNVDGHGEVDCIVFESGSMIFLYAHPDVPKLSECVICFEQDKLFCKEIIEEASFQLGIKDKLSRAHLLGIQRGQAQKDEADPLDEWMRSLKVIK